MRAFPRFYMPLAAFLLGACEGRFTVQENVTKSFAVSAAPRIVVESFNGEIKATVGIAGAVDVKVVKKGMGFDEDEAAANLAEVTVALDQVGDTVRVTALRPRCVDLCGDSSGADVEIVVPADARIELRTSNGLVTSTGVAGPLFLRTANGDIVARGALGRIDASTSNGSIEILQASAALVTADTSNGKITFTGTLAAGQHSLRSSNGGIDVTLPANLIFRIDAATSNGRVLTDFLVNRTDTGESTLVGTVGDANPATTVQLETSNGNIDIRRLMQ